MCSVVSTDPATDTPTPMLISPQLHDVFVSGFHIPDANLLLAEEAGGMPLSSLLLSPESD